MKRVILIAATLFLPVLSFAADHIANQPAAHMELKNRFSEVVCNAYDTDPALPPSVTDCPSGTYSEQLFNSDWEQISERTVVLEAANDLTQAAGRLAFDTFQNTRDNSNSIVAECGGGGQAIGGSCSARVNGVAIPLITDTTISTVTQSTTVTQTQSISTRGFTDIHSCRTDQPATITATVNCSYLHLRLR